MSENLWRPRLESYLAVREAMGHSVRAERKLLGEFLDLADQKGGAGPIRAEWALDWACMLSPRRGVGGQAGRLSVVRNFLTYLRAFIAETEVPHHGLLRGPNRPKPYLFSADEIRCMLAATMELGPRNSLRPHTCHRSDRAGMAPERLFGFARRQVPNAQRLVPGAGDHVSAIGCDCHRIGQNGMALERLFGFAR